MCILLVEDEVLIRVILAEELTEAGFEVREAEDGEQAAEVIRREPAGFTLLVTDIHMPGKIDGTELVRLMRACHPEVPLICTTGRPDLVPTARQLGVDALLPKPFTPADLMRVIRDLLQKTNRGHEPKHTV